VFSFNGRDLIGDEAKCIENCSQRYLASQTRLSRNFADAQLKKMNDAQVKLPEQEIVKT
jgi:hypothetical protein